MKKFTRRLIAGLLAGSMMIVSLPSNVWADVPAGMADPAGIEDNTGTTEAVSYMTQQENPEIIELKEEAEEQEAVVAEIMIEAEEQKAKEESETVEEEPEIETEASEEAEEPGEIHLETKVDDVTVRVDAEEGAFPGCQDMG